VALIDTTQHSPVRFPTCAFLGKFPLNLPLPVYEVKLGRKAKLVLFGAIQRFKLPPFTGFSLSLLPGLPSSPSPRLANSPSGPGAAILMDRVGRSVLDLPIRFGGLRLTPTPHP